MSDTLKHNRETVRRLYEECINRGDLTLLPELFAPDFEGLQGVRGPEGYARVVTSLRAGLPDVVFSIEQLIAEGDHVAVRWRWQGTHTGVFQGHAPTHKCLVNSGIAIYRLRAAAIVSAELETDRLGVLQQIGVIS